MTEQSHKIAKVIELLAQLAALSDNHGYSWHADCIRETIKAFGISEESGWDHLASIQFWGGAGSICDAGFGPDDAEFHRRNGRPVPSYLDGLSKEDYEADNARYKKLLSEIARQMDGSTKSEDRLRWMLCAKRIGEIFETWLADPANAKIMEL